MTTPEDLAQPRLAGVAAALLRGDALPLGVILIDTESSTVLQLNGEALRLLGLTRSAVLDSTVARCFPAELASACTPERWQALARLCVPARRTVALTSRHGKRWLKVQMSLLPTSPGASQTGLLTLQDNSAERQLERALQESDSRFREVTEAVSECLLVTTPQWDRLHFSSPLLLDMLGLSSLELRLGPQRFRECVHPLDRPLYDRRLLKQAAGGSTDFVVRIEHPVKGQRWLRLRTRLQVQAEQPLVYAILADVTEAQQRHQELRAARDRAEAASRAKSEFMARMSHEFRTPLNGMLGMTDLLLRTQLTDAQRQHAELAQRCAEDLLRLTSDVLDFTRVDGADRGLDEQSFAPQALAQQALDRHRLHARAKGLCLDLALAPALPSLLRGDARRIAQVLDRLIDNALKFTDQGGALLRLSERLDDTEQLWLEVEVSDSGIGIEPAELPHLTMAFTQGNGSTARRHDGAGLGLAMAQQLLVPMGGQLAVRALAEGGSAFSFAVRVHAPLPSLPEHADAQHALQGRYILVVEDNPVNQEVIAQMLTHLGVQVRVTADGVSGLQALREERFDLVMMDIHMPGMDGIETLRRFRLAGAGAGKSAPATPVVAVTANALSGDQEMLLRHGFDDYLPKPFRQHQLLALLMRHVSARANKPIPDSPMPLKGAVMTAEPTVSPTHDPDLLDAAAIARLRELDPDGANKLMERVVAAYMQSLERLLPELAAARVGDIDLAVVRHVSHTLKSSSASLGALALARRCAEIEALARTNQMDGLGALLDAMLGDITKVRVALLDLLNPGL